MHWFESELVLLDQLAELYLKSQQQSGTDIVNVSEDIRIKRGRFIGALQSIVNKVVNLNGINACAAYHEGLVLAYAEAMPNIDALGVMIQESVNVTQQSARILKLGDIQQIVIVGAVNKVAMLSVGPVVLCIVCSNAINLASVLSQENEA
ncbi:MAG: roadblock/LC7 domain-containing protein [Methylococcaceae bacterium]|nr:roadblock/LC7 domain-containing protein [Methylococcaceae bacterium]